MKKKALSTFVAGATLVLGSLSGTASAGMPVIDAAHIAVSTGNLTANTVSAASNLATSIKMHALLANQERFRQEGNYYWNSFELSNTVNNYYDNEAEQEDVIIPIPIDIGYEDLVDQQEGFDDAIGYEDEEDGSDFVWDDLDLRNSRNMHRTNGALLETVQSHQAAITNDVQRTRNLTDNALLALKSNAGRNVQLQYQNLLMADQIKNLTQMRGLMLAGENQRVARAQADADREAREMVSGRKLRAGADPMLMKTSSNRW